MEWKILPFPSDDRTLRRAAARILVDAFREHWPEAWPDLEAGAAEVDDALDAEKVAFAALTDDRGMLGWIAAQPQYGGNVWELHPLAVAPGVRGRGIGRALVERLEREVRSRGALTLWLGTDDETGLTSVGGIDLYPGVLEKVMRIEDRRGHPLGFYRRLGFEVVGVVPDANGFGRPDILMAKRVGDPE